MPIYEFPMPGDDTATPPDAARLRAVLDLLGLSAGQVVAERRGPDTVRLTGTVPDAEAHEKLLLAVGNLEGVARVDDRLTQAREASLLGSLGGFARLPAGAASADMAEEMVHEAAPGRRHADDVLGPAGSAFHIVRPGESLDDIARLHHGDTTAALRILHANRPMLARADALKPGMVLRVPPLRGP